MAAAQGGMSISGPDAFAAAFSVSRETCDRLIAYEALLKRWQGAYNLVAPKTLEEIWSRHFADSAQLVALAPQARRFLDLGSGAGFPGMVIAILKAGEAGVRVDLVESNAKKCAFLDAVRRQTGAPAHINRMRIEEAARRLTGPFDVITARALAPLNLLLGLAEPFMGAGTICLFPKGRDMDLELATAQQRWKIDYEAFASLTEPEGRILMIDSLQRR